VLLLRRMAYVRTVVSEETAVSIFGVAKLGSDRFWSNFDNEMFGFMCICEYPEDRDNTFLRNVKTNLLPYKV
jgi:hypothetical protein